MNREFCRHEKCTIQELIDKAPWDLRILKNCEKCLARKYRNWQIQKIFKGEYQVGQI